MEGNTMEPEGNPHEQEEAFGESPSLLGIRDDHSDVNTSMKHTNTINASYDHSGCFKIV